MYGDNENDERRAEFEKLLFAAVDEAVRVHPEKPAEWGVPQPLTHDELPEVMPFKIEYLPRGIRDLVHDVAYRMSVPTDFPAIVGVVALAGVVNRRAHVYPRQHDKTWKEALNLPRALVADPGKGKTPTVTAMTQALTEVAKEYVEVNKRNLAEWTKRRDSAGDEDFDEEQPPAQRLYTTDTTIEALHKMMADNPQGIFYLRDEMTGWLADLEKKGHESDRQFYLSAWSEQYWQSDRVVRGNVNAEICLSMFGNFQPEPLKEVSSAGGCGRFVSTGAGARVARLQTVH